MTTPLKKLFQDLARRVAGEWLETQPAWLGDFSGTVQTGTSGMVYARLVNGKVVEAFNQLAPLRFDVPVKIGRSRTLPKIWQVIEVREFWDTPTTSGEVSYHAEQHMFGAGDMVPIDRRQVLQLTALVSDADNFVVTVFGAIVHTATGIRMVSTQTVDLSSYVVTAGAKYVNIEVDDEGTLWVHEGELFGAPDSGTAADIPVPESGKHILATVVLHEGQASLLNDNIVVPAVLVPTAIEIVMHEDQVIGMDDDVVVL